MGFYPNDLASMINGLPTDGPIPMSYKANPIPLDNERREMLVGITKSDAFAMHHCLKNCERFPNPDLRTYCQETRCNLKGI